MTWSVLTPSASPSKLRSTRWRSAGVRDRAHVVDAGGEAPVEERADLGREEHRLRAARRAAVADEALREVGRVGTVGVRRLEDADRVVLHVPRDRHLAHELLHLEDRLAVEDRLRAGRCRRRS